MKKLFGTVLATVLMAAGLASCSNDGNHSEAQCNYYVVTDSIVYSDLGNKQYDSIIRICLGKMEISSYYFSERAESNTSSSVYAMALCNQQAKTTYENKMKQIFPLKDVQEKLFALNDSLFRANNIHNAQEIGLKAFTVKTSLYNTLYLEDQSVISKKDAQVK